MKNFKERKIIFKPRIYGDTIKLLMEFLILGKEGKSIIFATPKGNFLSPKAVEQALKEQKKEIIKQIETRKQFTHKRYGTSKYDSTYDESIDIIRKI